MKKSLLFLLLVVAFSGGAQQKQSLKDLLYGGKLKLDSTAVIRKSDDLSTKIDTAAKKAPEPESPKPAIAETAPAIKPVSADTAFGDSTATEAVTTGNAPANGPTAPTKNNNKILKEFTDSLTSTLKTEVLSSKKIKKDTYYLMLEYEIGTDGMVNVLNVVATPENAFLQEEIKKRLTYATPQLQPAADSSGKARKVKRKYNFTVTKE
jgi:hypothetical protein